MFSLRAKRKDQSDKAENTRVCRFNTYCRTRSFADAAAQGTATTYYEAAMDSNNTWTILKVEERAPIRTVRPTITQSIVQKNMNFETVLGELYTFETGAEDLNYRFSNTKNDLGLDHFHALAHAEGLAITLDGKIVETQNGRIVAEGNFRAEEKQAVLAASLNPAPEKKLERPTLSDIFERYARDGAALDIATIFDTENKKKEAIVFYDHLRADIGRMESEIRGCLDIFNNFIMGRSTYEFRIEMKKEENRSHWGISKKTTTKKSSPKERDREIFKKGGTGYGVQQTDGFEEAFVEGEKISGMTIPESIYDMCKEIRFFGSYLHAKGVFHSSLENDNKFKKAALSYSLDTLRKHYDELPKESEKPEWKTVEFAIATKTEEKMPEVFDRVKKAVKELQDFYAQDLLDFQNKTHNRANPKPQGASVK